jgi:hypothetical protein
VKVDNAHGSNTTLLCQIRELIDVDLEELGLRVVCGQFLEFRRYYTAGATPISIEVDEKSRVACEL